MTQIQRGEDGTRCLISLATNSLLALHHFSPSTSDHVGGCNRAALIVLTSKELGFPFQAFSIVYL